MRLVVAAVMAVALASTILAGDGLVLVPHTHGPGTPAEHPHGLALYRFPIALLGAPADVAGPRDDTVSFRMAMPSGELLVGAALLMTAAVAMAAAAATLRRTPLSRIAAASAPLWSASTPTGPPRLLSV